MAAMIVVWNAEFAQSYIAHARSSRVPSPNVSSSLRIAYRMGGATVTAGFITHIVSRRHTVFCCGSHAGRLCQPVPPGKRGDTMTAIVDGSAGSAPCLNDARHVTPSCGIAV